MIIQQKKTRKEQIIYLLGVDCGEPETGLNVNLTTENPTYNFTSTLEYVCADPMYACFGSFIISCQSDGQWSGNVPTCSELNFYSH